MSSGCWVPCCAKAAETCSRSDESRRSWVLVACCLRVRAPAPVLAWVPLRSMGPVGPGRWSARHRSGPERSAMTRGPGLLVCAPRAAGPRAVGLCSPALRLPSMRPCAGLCRWSSPLRSPSLHAHRCALPAWALRATGLWSPERRGACPASSSCAIGPAWSYVKPRGRTPTARGRTQLHVVVP